MHVSRGAPPPRATSARAATTSVARASAAGAASQSSRSRPGSAAAAVRAEHYSNVRDATVSVYGGGMRALMQLRREAERAAPDRPLAHTLPSQERARAQLVEQQQREAAAAEEEARVARAAQRRRQEYLRAQGLADVKPKVWEAKEAKELPPRARPKSAAPRLAATATENTTQAAAALASSHTGGPSREVRSAANRAILRANQQLLDKKARQRAAAEEAAAEAESKKKARWSALRDTIMDKVEADRQQRKAMIASLALADTHDPVWMQVTNPPEPEPPAEVEDAEAAARDLSQQQQQRSMAAWRRQHGVAEGTPVFVVRDAYGVGVKTRLVQRGWAENCLEGAVTTNLLWTLRGQVRV